MNTHLKQTLLNQIDQSVDTGVYPSEEDAVTAALMGLRSEEIMEKIEVGRQQVKDGDVYLLDENFAADLKREIQESLISSQS
ncbi:MAG: hypothetical protein GKR87_16820 [Kiritimatiellae bacterium]|nr:hypothetical protein [Kiritimatiellia bacterium]